MRQERLRELEGLPKITQTAPNKVSEPGSLSPVLEPWTIFLHCPMTTEDMVGMVILVYITSIHPYLLVLSVLVIQKALLFGWGQVAN